MTDTWKFTLPDDKTCWDDLKEWAAPAAGAAADCTGTATAAGALTVPPSAKVDTFAVAEGTAGWLLTACSDTEIKYKAAAAEADAAAATEVTLAIPAANLKDGKVECLQIAADGVPISFTLKGMAKEEAKDETSGAMSLASAVAAGALAVAATQF